MFLFHQVREHRGLLSRPTDPATLLRVEPGASPLPPKRPGRFFELPPLALGPFSPRPARAYLPSRARLERPHATLVLLDGQNVFGDHGSYAGGWHAHEAIDGLGPTFWPTVIVGVPNDGLGRMQEYGSHVRDFLAALVAALPPLCRAGPCFIGGSSMGGLAALWAWIHHPEVFDGALVMSPSLWYGHRALLHHLQRGDWALPAQGRLYLDVGARERGRMLADSTELARALAPLGPERLMWRPDARGTHHERHWRRRLPKALRFLLRKARPETPKR